jgi:hypothetical protein
MGGSSLAQKKEKHLHGGRGGRGGHGEEREKKRKEKKRREEKRREEKSGFLASLGMTICGGDGAG